MRSDSASRRTKESASHRAADRSLLPPSSQIRSRRATCLSRCITHVQTNSRFLRLTPILDSPPTKPAPSPCRLYTRRNCPALILVQNEIWDGPGAGIDRGQVTITVLIFFEVAAPATPTTSIRVSRLESLGE